LASVAPGTSSVPASLAGGSGGGGGIIGGSGSSLLQPVSNVYGSSLVQAPQMSSASGSLGAASPAGYPGGMSSVQNPLAFQSGPPSYVTGASSSPASGGFLSAENRKLLNHGARMMSSGQQSGSQGGTQGIQPPGIMHSSVRFSPFMFSRENYRRGRR
jgi:hypothetical protein